MKAKEIIALLGEPGDSKNFVKIQLPFPMKYAGKPVASITCHQKAAPSLLLILSEIFQVYGLAKIQELQIDDFGGCYNLRPMRGTEEKYDALIKEGKTEEAAEFLSVHSWAAAVDLNASRNLLKQNHTTAQFAKPEYKPMIDIFYKHGWYSLGREQDRDYMHFQFVKP